MSDAENPTALSARTGDASSEVYDVAILGGGLAGLTLALQLKQARPTLKLLVMEKQKYPVAEAAHKVGESTVEIGAHYLRSLGLQVYLETQQLIKFGLRFFFSTGDNRDITQRVEFGHAVLPPLNVETYQLDRGRLENALSRELSRRAIPLWNGSKVQQVLLQPQDAFHRVRVLHEGEERTIQARWVVDASGRSSLLKRQLGLAKKVGHAANAVWFRLNCEIDIDEWSDDPVWQSRIVEGERWLSTNHLMGPGYWVWLIPLASGSTSIGIVADASMHPFEKMNRFEWALDWLQEHEPQCAQAIEQHRDTLQDFRVMKDYAYSSEQVYSGERWCLTGEAGVFLDPFYSPGSDMIAISNGLVGDLITRDLDGADTEDLADRAAIHNRLLLLLNTSWLSIYEHQYPLMGNAQVMIAKIVWDTAVYWAIPGLLYFNDKFLNVVDSPEILLHLLRFSLLNEHVQAFLRAWHEMDQSEASKAFIKYYDFDFMPRLHLGLVEVLSDAEFDARFAANMRFVECLAGQLVSTVIEVYAHSESAAIQSQVERWRIDAALMELVTLYQQMDPQHPIDGGWMTLGHQYQERQEIAR